VRIAGQSIKPIRAMGSEDTFETLARAEAHELQTSMSRQVSITHLMRALQEPMLALGIAVAIIAGSTVLQEDFSTLALVGFALWRIGIHVNLANRAYRELVVSEPYYWSLQNTIETSRVAREEDPGGRMPPSPPISVELEHVGFSHGDTRVLDNLSMQIPAGAITAIVGDSGIGKTTLVDLLLALQQPQDGRILIDGVPLSEISIRSWRRNLGYVPQETTLFHGSVLENVALGDRTLTESDVRVALEAAGAWDFVESMDNNVHTAIGELGSRLSGGQRQRLAIGRALVRKPALLLLDELTASLDPQAEARVIATIKALTPQATVVVVTHRAPLIEIADVVYRLDGGGARKLTPSA
jgi:ATP-binding cassette subfamily C protein